MRRSNSPDREEDDSDADIAAAMDELDEEKKQQIEEEKRPDDQRYFAHIDTTSAELSAALVDFFQDVQTDVKKTYVSLSRSFGEQRLDLKPAVEPDRLIIHGATGNGGIFSISDVKETRKKDSKPLSFIPSPIVPDFFGYDRVWLLKDMKLDFLFQLDKTETKTFNAVAAQLNTDNKGEPYSQLDLLRQTGQENPYDPYIGAYELFKSNAVPDELAHLQRDAIGSVEDYAKMPYIEEYKANKIAVPQWNKINTKADRVDDQGQKKFRDSMKVVKKQGDEVLRSVSKYTYPPLDTDYSSYNRYEERLRCVLGFYNIWGDIDVQAHVYRLLQYQMLLQNICQNVNLEKQNTKANPVDYMDTWIQSEKAARLLRGWYYEVPFWICCVYALMGWVVSGKPASDDYKLNGPLWRAVDVLYTRLKDREMERLIYYTNRFGQNLFYLNNSEENLQRATKGLGSGPLYIHPTASDKWMKTLKKELKYGSFANVDQDSINMWTADNDATPSNIAYYKELCRIDLDEMVYRSVLDIAPWSTVGVGAWSMYTLAKIQANRAKPSSSRGTWYHLRRLRRAVRDRFKEWTDPTLRMESSELKWIVDQRNDGDTSRLQRYSSRSKALHQFLVEALDIAQARLHPDGPEVMTRSNLNTRFARRYLPVIAMRRPVSGQTTSQEIYNAAQRDILRFLRLQVEVFSRDPKETVTREDVDNYAKILAGRLPDPSHRIAIDIRKRATRFLSANLNNFADSQDVVLASVRKFMDNVLEVDGKDVPEGRRVQQKEHDTFMRKSRQLVSKTISDELKQMDSTASILSGLVWNNDDFDSVFRGLQSADRKQTQWLRPDVDNPEGILNLSFRVPREGDLTRTLRNYADVAQLYERSTTPGAADDTTRRLAYRKAVQYAHLRDVLDRSDDNRNLVRKYLRLNTSHQPPYLLSVGRGNQPPFLRAQGRGSEGRVIERISTPHVTDADIQEYVRVLRDHDQALYIDESFDLLLTHREQIEDALGISILGSDQATDDDNNGGSGVYVDSGRAFWRLVAQRLTDENDDDDSSGDEDEDIWQDETDETEDDNSTDDWKLNRHDAHYLDTESSKRRTIEPNNTLDAFLRNKAIENLSSAINFIAAAEEYQTNLKSLAANYVELLQPITEDEDNDEDDDGDDEKQQEIDQAWQQQRTAPLGQNEAVSQPEDDDTELGPIEPSRSQALQESAAELRDRLMNYSRSVKNPVEKEEETDEPDPVDEKEPFVEDDSPPVKGEDMVETTADDYLQQLQQIEDKRLGDDNDYIDPVLATSTKRIVEDEPTDEQYADLDLAPLTADEVLAALQSDEKEDDTSSALPAVSPEEEKKANSNLKHWIVLSDSDDEVQEIEAPSKKKARTGAHLEVVQSDNDDDEEVSMLDSWLWMADLYLDIGTELNSQEQDDIDQAIQLIGKKNSTSVKPLLYPRKQLEEWQDKLPSFLLPAMRSDQVVSTMAKPAFLIKVQFEWLSHAIHHKLHSAVNKILTHTGHRNKLMEDWPEKLDLEKEAASTHHIHHMQHKADDLYDNPPPVNTTSPYRTYSREKVLTMAKGALTALQSTPSPSSAMIASTKRLLTLSNLLVTSLRNQDQVHGAVYRMVVISVINAGAVSPASVSGGRMGFGVIDPDDDPPRPRHRRRQLRPAPPPPLDSSDEDEVVDGWEPRTSTPQRRRAVVQPPPPPMRRPATRSISSTRRNLGRLNFTGELAETTPDSMLEVEGEFPLDDEQGTTAEQRAMLRASEEQKESM